MTSTTTITCLNASYSQTLTIQVSMNLFKKSPELYILEIGAYQFVILQSNISWDLQVGWVFEIVYSLIEENNH